MWLAPHVRACRCADVVILLDLQRNRYLSVGGRAASALDGPVGGWPQGPVRPAEPHSPQALATLTAQLREQGLLVLAPVTPPEREPMPEATASWPSGDHSSTGTVHPLHLGRLLRHALAASLALRCQSFAAIAAHLAACRRRQARASTDGRAYTWRDTVSAFVSLRPLVLSTHERCLHDSLTLARMLVTVDASTRWVVGVRTSPFAAHAWVQRGPVVLGDDHERIRRFVPILTA